MKKTITAIQQMAHAFQQVTPLVSALSADLQAILARRRKMKRFMKMQKAMQKQPAQQSFGIATATNGIATGNHPAAIAKSTS